MKYEELMKLVTEDPDRYVCFTKWEGKLVCPNPREEATRKGIPCLLCGSFMDINAKCRNPKCELFTLK